MSWFKPTNLFDRVFESSLLIKAATGVAELIGGALALFIDPASIHRFILTFTQQELLNDPNDKVSNFLIHATAHLTSNGHAFLVAYLWTHAAVKLTAVIGILRNQLWAYPFSLITLGAMMIYQIYSLVFVKLTIGMSLLTIFDVFVLWMIWTEYQRVKVKLSISID